MVDLLDIKRKECYEQNSINGTFNKTEKFCKLTFDGIMCWTATKTDTLAIQQCPNYLVNSNEFASKKCESDGEWYIDKNFNTSWTNYSQCWKMFDNETALVALDIKIENSTLYHTWFPVIKKISQWGYAISLLTLISSMIIFSCIKKLQCARNRLHMHLFTSFILRAFMSLLKDFLFVEGLAMQSDIVFSNGRLQYVKEHYNWICKAIISLRNYFIMANYMLILMEGIYLHNLMFLTLFFDSSHIAIYYTIGWGLPLLFIISWSLVRLHYEDTYCWTTSENKYYLMLIQVPTALSVIINFILFILIVRMLLLKLNSTYIQHQKTKYKRLIRSTLILMPLFGVPYTISLVMFYISTTNQTIELIWLLCDQTFTAFQGFFVGTVYCLLNSEVHLEMKNKYKSITINRKYFKKSRERTISNTQQIPISILPLQEQEDYL